MDNTKIVGELGHKECHHYKLVCVQQLSAAELKENSASFPLHFSKIKIVQSSAVPVAHASHQAVHG